MRKVAKVCLGIINHKFFILVFVAGAAGVIADTIITMFTTLPDVVEWCIAGSVGYMAAEIADLVIERLKKSKCCKT